MSNNNKKEKSKINVFDDVGEVRNPRTETLVLGISLY